MNIKKNITENYLEMYYPSKEEYYIIHDYEVN